MTKRNIIEGDEAYKLGKSFMKTLMPSKVKLVKKHKENLPIFNHYDVETQIDQFLIQKSSLNLEGL